MMWLNILLIIISIALVTVILLQNRSAGMSGAFGGGGAEGFHVRRGGEKVLYRATIVLASLFILTALAHLLI